MRRVLQHAIVVTHPHDVFLGGAQQSLRHFLLGSSNAGQTLRGHVRIVRTLVVIGIDNDQDLVVVAIKQRNRPAGPEHVIVRMRRKDENSFVVEVFEARLLRLP